MAAVARNQAACPRPPQLALQPERLPPVALAAASPDPTASPDPARPAAAAAITLANAGGLPLAARLSLERRSADTLVPALWLDPAASGTRGLAARDAPACCPLAARVGAGPEALGSAGGAAGAGACAGAATAWGACAGGGAPQGARPEARGGGPGRGDAAGGGGAASGVVLRGGAGAMLRLAATLRPPAALRGSLVRRAACDSHFLVLSARPRAPARRGAPLTLTLPTPGVCRPHARSGAAHGRPQRQAHLQRLIGPCLPEGHAARKHP
jgi:hypothetical protein